MALPGTEKLVPAFRQVFAALAMFAASQFAAADTEADFQAGLAAYRVNDVVGAMAPLKKAADAGHAHAQALYGEILDSAELDDEALEYFLKSAQQRHPDGIYGLAKLYLTGEAKAPDAGAASRLMREAADMGHAVATVTLALAFVRGDAGLGASEQDSAEARNYLQKAGELGEVRVIAALVDGYRTGRYGLPVDPAKADEWAKRLPAAGTSSKGGKK